MKVQTICIIGLGYVGLPLAHAFAEKGYDVIGYDISEKRIEELKDNKDSTNELTSEQLKSVSITFSNKEEAIDDAEIIILALPTPVNEKNNPDLSLVENASQTVGKHLQKGTIVVYESTVYPGVTEEICGPILEKESGLVCGKDFFLGYSPERINPGDKQHTVRKIVKVVAGQDEKTTDTLCKLYGSIIEAGIHRAPNIKVAEMAKAIENAQRDLNIAYINEISKLCSAIDIDTTDVLDAASTKWNFLRFQPGLVGGHCIGVDPYYLIEKAKMLGNALPIVSAARATNDGMAAHVAGRICKGLESLEKNPSGCSVLILGMTFKENVPDTRNSQSPRVCEELEKQKCNVAMHDPYTKEETPLSDLAGFDCIALLVPHKEYLQLSTDEILKFGTTASLFFDLKSILRNSKDEFEKKGWKYECL